MQDFEPARGSYDVIWIQWVIGHLHDLDCIRFFRRCAAGLTPHGVIVLKDNILLDEDSDLSAECDSVGGGGGGGGSSSSSRSSSNGVDVGGGQASGGTGSSSGLTFMWDLADSSVARHLRYMTLILRLAGLNIVLMRRQQDFPEELFPVLMMAIAPASPVITA